MKKIIVIETTTTGSGFDLFKNTPDDWSFFLFTAKPNKYKELTTGNLYKNLKVVDVDTSSMESCSRKINSEVGVPNAILSMSDRYIVIANKLASNFKCVHNDPKFIQIAQNKGKLRELLKKYDLSTVSSFLISPEIGNEFYLKLSEYPYIVKSNNGTGSMNVFFANNISELRNAVNKLFNIGVQPLIEKFITGPLVSNEVFLKDGSFVNIGITSRTMSNFPYFAETSCSFPMKLPVGLERKVLDQSKLISKKLHIRHGPLHIEYILSSQGPVLVEVNPRLGGGPIGPMIEGCLKHSLYQSIVREMLGETFNDNDLEKNEDIANAAVLVYADKPGKVIAVDSKMAENYPGVQSISIFANQGTRINRIGDYSSEVARIYTTAENSELAFYRGFAARNAISVRIEGD